MSDEYPRFQHLKASCCEVTITRFDLPSREAALNEESIVRHGWHRLPSGELLCDVHKRQAAQHLGEGR